MKLADVFPTWNIIVVLWFALSFIVHIRFLMSSDINN